MNRRSCLRSSAEGDLARAIVYYASIWTFAVVYGSLLVAPMDKKTELMILLPLALALALVKFWLVPKAPWDVWCREEAPQTQPPPPPRSPEPRERATSRKANAADTPVGRRRQQIAPLETPTTLL